MYIGSLIKVWFIPDSGLVKIRLRQALTVKVTAGFNLWLYTISWTTGHKLELCVCMPITQDSLKRNRLLDAVIGGLLQDFHPLFVSTILSYLWQWNYIPYSYTSATFIHIFNCYYPLTSDFKIYKFYLIPQHTKTTFFSFLLIIQQCLTIIQGDPKKAESLKMLINLT